MIRDGVYSPPIRESAVIYFTGGTLHVPCSASSPGAVPLVWSAGTEGRLLPLPHGLPPHRARRTREAALRLVASPPPCATDTTRAPPAPRAPLRTAKKIA
eukprot:4869425-Pleurochrysis_carterae.AAC.1